MLRSFMTKPRSFNIDVGVNNVGSAIRVFGDDSFPEYIEKSSMLVTKDGRVYNEFKESLAPELAMNWIRDRWDLIKGCEFVNIESQHAKQFTVNERRCLMLCYALYTILFSYSSMSLGPPPHLMNPELCKRLTDLKVDSDVKKTGASKQHTQNKNLSVQRFLSLFPLRAYGDRINKITGGDKMDDIADAYFIGKASEINREKINQAISITRHHNRLLHDPTKLITVADRKRPIMPLGSDEPNSIVLEAGERNKLLMEYSKKRAQSAQARKVSLKEAKFQRAIGFYLPEIKTEEVTLQPEPKKRRKTTQQTSV